MFQYCGYIHLNLSTPLTFVDHRTDTIYISEISLSAVPLIWYCSGYANVHKVVMPVLCLFQGQDVTCSLIILTMYWLEMDAP